MFDQFSLRLFFVVVIELVVGGGGRLTALGPVSLRMVLFAGALVATAIHFYKGRRIPADYLLFMGIIALMLASGTLVGILNGSAPANIWEDVKPQLYFLLLPFFYFSVNDTEIVKKLNEVFKYSSVGMAVIFIATLILIHTGIVPFLNFWNLVLSTQEFFFRGELTFFYKGFMYLCVGLFFLVEGHAKRWQVMIVIIAIALTVTRGFWVSLLLTYGAYYLVFSQKKMQGAISIAAAVVLIFFSSDMIAAISRKVDRETSPAEKKHEPKPYLLGDRTHSDNERRRQFNEVKERVSPLSAVIGHGLGQGVPIRPIHMEVSYLEIFHKQGVIGLGCWLLIFLTGLLKFIRARSNSATVPYFLSFVFVFVESLSNQFINNPIGFSLIMISIVCIDRIRNDVGTFSSRQL